MITQGRRKDFTSDQWTILEPGDYGKCMTDGEWYFRPPVDPETKKYFGIGGLKLHTIVEHDDGTITVSPSILCTGHHEVQWHGYLECGVWREV